ncbi:DNA-processing protein DprA [Virgibacillus sp. 6R]|uniref:DNA-processing protein DprA n=1 Tax=Metabacillus sp. 22489 TaxID=3453928 RepID=UPI0011A9FA3B
MDVKTKRLFILSHCKRINKQLLSRLSTQDSSFHSFLMLNEDEWEMKFHIKKETIRLIKQEYRSYSFEELYTTYQKQNISFLPIFDEKYPSLLKEIPDPPPYLYYKGDIRLLDTLYLLSVVGTRHPTNYGQKALETVLKPLINMNWVIVSGLAKGIDTFAHEAAIAHGGRTVAVIAGGLNHLYPRENRPLANQLMEHHLILSEHSPSTPPQKWHFPKRNRIISGLSLGTLIVQAKKRSGSLITAYQALEQNREVFAIPGSIFDDFSAGTNELIRNGAKLVMDANDILEEFYLK